MQIATYAEKPSFWSTLAKLRVNRSDFRQSHASSSEKLGFYTSRGQREQRGLSNAQCLSVD